MEATKVKSIKTEGSIGTAVTLAFLHQAITVPGRIGSERTLSNAKIPGIKLHWLPSGLVFDVKGTRGIIPAANVAVCVFEAE